MNEPFSTQNHFSQHPNQIATVLALQAEKNEPIIRQSNDPTMVQAIPFCAKGILWRARTSLHQLMVSCTTNYHSWDRHDSNNNIEFRRGFEASGGRTVREGWCWRNENEDRIHTKAHPYRQYANRRRGDQTSTRRCAQDTSIPDEGPTRVLGVMV